MNTTRIAAFELARLSTTSMQDVPAIAKPTAMFRLISVYYKHDYCVQKYFGFANKIYNAQNYFFIMLFT